MSKRLGRGLEDIIETGGRSAPSFVMVQSDQIRPNRFQPRVTFDEQALNELKQSIKKQGVLQPVIVRPIAHGTYELVAGERRWRAAQAVGIQEIPAIVKTLSDQEAVEFSLIENVQREDLNPIEEANAYRKLSENFGYTQEEIASGVGKDRATIANALRLLKLPVEVQDALRSGAISMGHARALLAVEGAARQLELLQRAMREKLSVRQMEATAGSWQPVAKKRPRRTDPESSAIANQLRRALGTKVNLTGGPKRGRIVIDYYSPEDLTRIIALFGIGSSDPAGT